jgi:hypothetical protein
MQLNDYSKAYDTRIKEDVLEKNKNNFKLLPFLQSLQLSQISLIILVFAIVYFVDYLNFFNSMHGFMTPSPILGVASAASNLTKGKMKEKQKKK